MAAIDSTPSDTHRYSTSELLDEVFLSVVRMTNTQRLSLLRDLVQNMNERNSCEEITRFVVDQLGGDAPEVAKSQLSLPPKE